MLDCAFLEPDCFSFDSLSARTSIARLVNESTALNLTPLISSVLLCGNAHLNGGANAVMYADRLKTIIPDARIFIVVREQFSWLESFYKMEVCANRYPLRPETLLNLHGILDQDSKFLVSFLFYDKLIGYYKKLFGEKNVLVLPYEYLCAAPNSFLRELFSFARVAPREIFRISFSRVNAGVPTGFVRVRRLANALCQFYLGGRFDISDELCQMVAAYSRPSHGAFFKDAPLKYPNISEKIAKSNRNTERICGIDLKSIGYI